MNKRQYPPDSYPVTRPLRSEEEAAARLVEIGQCIDHGGTCGQTGMRPAHFAAAACTSGGRKWNAALHIHVGRSHCTCDSCF